MRVLLVTNRTDLSTALCVFLSERAIEVVGVADETAGLPECLAKAHADVIIVDSRLEDALSSEWIGDLRLGEAPTPVVILSTSRHQNAAEVAGADSLVLLGDPPEVLVAALEHVRHRREA